MRPTNLESLRAVQAALAEIIVPELTSPFAQDAAGTLQMLLESIAGEWDTAAQDLMDDNETVRSLLSASRDLMVQTSAGNHDLADLVSAIDEALGKPAEGALTLTALTSRNEVLRATLEHLLVAIEDLIGEAGYERLELVRRDIYAHLRNVAARGWSFWDVSSFRSRMAEVRASIPTGDERAARALE